MSQAVIVLNLLAGVGAATLLGVLTWVSWHLVRSPATPHTRAMRSATRRVISILWAAVAVFVLTATYVEVTSASLGLPHSWQSPTTLHHRGYALLALGAQLFMAQLLLGMCALSRGGSSRALVLRTRSPRGLEHAADVGAALVTTTCLAATVCAFAAMAIVGYVQLLASIYA